MPPKTTRLPSIYCICGRRTPSSINYAVLEGGGDQINALRDGAIGVAVGGVAS